MVPFCEASPDIVAEGVHEAMSRPDHPTLPMTDDHLIVHPSHPSVMCPIFMSIQRLKADIV